MNKNEMSFNTIGKMLRKKNRGQYRLLALCQFLAVLMVSLFSIMLTSYTVLNILPEGGDSRKQMYMIFVASLFGCGMFLLYALGLFFRYKSRETGIFMALGAKRKQVKSLLEKEVLGIGILAGGAGILLAYPLDFLLWGMFRLFVPESEEMIFVIDKEGYLWGIAFFVFTLVLFSIKCQNDMRRMNLMDILREEHKSEPVKEIKGWYGWGGILMMTAGCGLGYLKDSICINYLKMMPPLWLEAIYLLIPIGLYLFLLYTIIHGWGKRGKYRHIISHSMMKFQGRQTVRNMVVIAVLTAAGLFGIFYIPTMLSGSFYTYNERPYDYNFVYRKDQDMISMEEIRELARKKQVEITKEEQVDRIILARDGYFRDFEENGHLKEEYRSPYVEANIIRQSDFNRLEKQNIEIQEGHYVYIRTTEDSGDDDGVYNKMNEDIHYFMNYVTGEKLSVKCQKNTLAQSEVLRGCIVLNDQDFDRIKKGLTFAWEEKMILFNVKDVKSTYSFAKELYEEIIKGSGEEVCVPYFYDRVEKDYYNQRGEMYWADQEESKLSYREKNNTNFTMYWKYYPEFRVKDQQEMVTQFAVFLMLFAFIAVILFASVVLIAYTRSLSIAMNHRQVYKDVKHLGASKVYLRDDVKNQISKVFFVPVVIGGGLVYFFYVLILTFNSGIFLSVSEWIALGLNFVVMGIMIGIVYWIYRFTLKKVYRILKI